ncbi:Hypothetical predicted protein, partial [Pelobates cultripes]
HPSVGYLAASSDSPSSSVSLLAPRVSRGRTRGRLATAGFFIEPRASDRLEEGAPTRGPSSRRGGQTASVFSSLAFWLCNMMHTEPVRQLEEG